MGAISKAVAALTAVLLHSVSARGSNLIYDYDGYNNFTYGQYPNQTFRSSNLIAPRLLVSKWESEFVDSTPYLFMGFWSPLGSIAGPFIYATKDLTLVYGEQEWPSAHNVRIQTFDDVDYLVFFQGNQREKGHSFGQCLFYDSSYQLAFSISSDGLSSQADMHECQVTEEGTVLITVYEPLRTNLTYPDGQGHLVLLDSVFQEIDIRTNASLFTWRASDHIAFKDTFMDHRTGMTQDGWDWFHINSVQKTHEGHFLISSRGAHAALYINGSSGDTIWTLGGKHSNFTNNSGDGKTDFALQHDVRVHDTDLTQVTMFDNHGAHTEVDCTANCSRGLHLELDHEDMTVHHVKDFHHPKCLASSAMGCYTIVPNGNLLIGWGKNPAFTEYTPDGEVVLDVQFRPWGLDEFENGHYRVLKMDWVGRPHWPPSIALSDGDQGDRYAYVSWNGATEVAYWQLVTRTSASESAQVASPLPKTDFEMAIPIPQGTRFAYVEAHDTDGQVIGVTKTVQMANGAESNGLMGSEHVELR